MLPCPSLASAGRGGDSWETSAHYHLLCFSLTIALLLFLFFFLSSFSLPADCIDITGATEIDLRIFLRSDLAMMPTDNSTHASGHGRQRHDRSYPRVVPYTSTTAFLVVPAAPSPRTPAPPLTLTAGATTASAVSQSPASALQPSSRGVVARQQLAYLADPSTRGAAHTPKVVATLPQPFYQPHHKENRISVVHGASSLLQRSAASVKADTRDAFSRWADLSPEQLQRTRHQHEQRLQQEQQRYPAPREEPRAAHNSTTASHTFTYQLHEKERRATEKARTDSFLIGQEYADAHAPLRCTAHVHVLESRAPHESGRRIAVEGDAARTAPSFHHHSCEAPRKSPPLTSYSTNATKAGCSGTGGGSARTGRKRSDTAACAEVAAEQVTSCFATSRRQKVWEQSRPVARVPASAADMTILSEKSRKRVVMPLMGEESAYESPFGYHNPLERTEEVAARDGCGGLSRQQRNFSQHTSQPPSFQHREEDSTEWKATSSSVAAQTDAAATLLRSTVQCCVAVQTSVTPVRPSPTHDADKSMDAYSDIKADAAGASVQLLKSLRQTEVLPMQSVLSPAASEGQYLSTDIATDATVLSALSPDTSSYAAAAAAEHDTVLVTPSPASSVSPQPHVVRDEVEGGAAARPAWCAEVTPTLSEVHGGGSLSVSVSPLVCGRLTYGTEEETESCAAPSPRAGGVLRSAVSPPVLRTSSLLPSNAHDTAARQQEPLFFLQRCHLLFQAEAAAREWAEVDASVQLHHIACEERLGYRVAEAAQYRRRLQMAVPYQPACVLQPCDLITPPPPSLRERRSPPEAAPVFCAAVAATRAETAAFTCAQGRRRMPSTSSLPPLSPRGKVEFSVEDTGDDEEEDAVSPKSCDSEAMLSLSTSPPPLREGRAVSPGEHEAFKDSGSSQSDTEAVAAPDFAAEASMESGEWEDASEENELEKVDENVSATEEAAALAEEHSPAACEADTTNFLLAAVPPSFTGSRNATRRSPPLRLQAQPPPLPASVLLPPALLELQHDEEDARYLLSGECPPPHVFQRWTERFLRDQPPHPEQLAVKERESDAQHDVQHQPPQRGEGGPSPEATEPMASSAGGEAVVCGVEVRTSTEAAASTTTSPSPDSRWDASPAAEAAATAALALQEGGRSMSRQRQCSERNLAWVMESFLDDVSGCDGGAATGPRETAAYEDDVGDDSGGKQEYNATGRYAPVPKFFGEDRSVEGNASAEESPGASSTSPSPSHTQDMYAAMNETAMPIEGLSASADAKETDAAAAAAVELVDLPSTTTMPIDYPSEESYEAPCGSERDAWLMLMDDFIEGLVKLMSSES